MSQSPNKREQSPHVVEYSSPKRAKTNTSFQRDHHHHFNYNPFTPGVADTIHHATHTHKRNKKNGGGRGGSSSSSTNFVPDPKLTKNKDNQQSTHDSTASPVNSLGNSSGVSSGDFTDAPQTPIQKIGNSQLEKTSTPPSDISSTGTKSHLDSAGTSTGLQLFQEKSSVTMDLRLGNEDYVVTIQKRSISTSTYENRKEDLNQLTQNPGMSDMLCNMILKKVVDQIAANYQESIQHHLLANSIPKIDFPDQ